MPSIEKFTLNPNYSRPPFKTLVAANKINGYTAFTKFAESTSIPINTERDVWDNPADLIYLLQEEFIEVSSSDAADNEVGTGARTMRIDGLSEAGDFLSENIFLDGLSPVVTGNKYYRVYRMQVLTAGTATSALGTISAIAAVSGTLQAAIIGSSNTTLMSHMTSPNGFVTVGKGFTVSVAADKSAIFRLYIRPPGGVFFVSDIVAVTGAFQRSREYGLAKIPEGADFKVTAQPSDNNVICTVSYDLVFIDNDLQGG